MEWNAVHFIQRTLAKGQFDYSKNAATISRCLSLSIFLSLPLFLTVVIISNAYRE